MEEILKQLREKIQSQTQNHESLAKKIHDEQIKIRKILRIDSNEDPFEPYYNPNLPLSSNYPEVYNENGDRIRFFFLCDRNFPHSPYGNSQRFIIWDRFNYGLENHFYTDEQIFHPIGNPKHRFGSASEPRSIKPYVYDALIRYKDWVEHNYDLIFTTDAQTLNSLSNARFVPLSAGYWLKGHAGHADEEPKISPDIYKHKSKMISMIASNKAMCEMHVFRQKLAWKCKNEKLADTFGKFDGGRWFKIEEPFVDYRYSIAVENLVSPLYFTEKITHCFAAQTVPIYVGATEIEKFFNPEGIIHFRVEDFDRIGEILKQCTVEDYQRRLPAILDNFERVKKYKYPFDFMFKEYLQKFFQDE